MIPSAVLAINTVLGEKYDKLLVEQNSEGLRRLQDPEFTVSTNSEERILDVLSQMDGGSIALAGPRGAGKSTLLKKFCSTSEKRGDVGIPVYVTAPAEYVPRDFLAELFQRLCEAYLSEVGQTLPEKFYAAHGVGKSALRYIQSGLQLMWLLLRLAVALALIAFIVRPYIVRFDIKSDYHTMITITEHWRALAYNTGLSWWNHYHILVAIVLLLLAFIIWPSRRKWRAPLRRIRGATLANRAIEYVQRLQIDKTFTWGGNISSPSVHGMSLALNRGGSFRYVPWSLPELVSNIRRFLEDVSEEMYHFPITVIIGIDEIDRIGSLEHAERFIGEIKAIFGVVRCFFLVSVAEDVGSLFAQRATAGRSILENAFDDIVVVEPLTLQEAQELLLRRVPGFTESFVYLVHALSGGLPRELIRIARRLVEVNRQPIKGAIPLIGDLSYLLVRDEMIESLRAARNQMALLSLDTEWATLFDDMRTAIIRLRAETTTAINDARVVIEKISEFQLPGALRRLSGDDERSAQAIIDRLSASAYFCKTIIEAFANEKFTLESVRSKTRAGGDGAYENLAAARVELSISPSSSREILTRFRASQ